MLIDAAKKEKGLWNFGNKRSFILCEKMFLLWRSLCSEKHMTIAFHLLTFIEMRKSLSLNTWLRFILLEIIELSIRFFYQWQRSFSSGVRQSLSRSEHFERTRDLQDKVCVLYLIYSMIEFKYTMTHGYQRCRISICMCNLLKVCNVDFLLSRTGASCFILSRNFVWITTHPPHWIKHPFWNETCMSEELYSI